MELTHSPLQIRAELTHHNIRVYPFDNEDNDPEENTLNEAIRVSEAATRFAGFELTFTRRI